MGNKIITEKDFWMCTGGNMPAPLQSTRLSTKKQSGEKYITKIDTSTSSIIDFGCKKAMFIMAILAAVIAVCVAATGGAALIAIGAIAGAAGAAVGAVAGGLLCGQMASMARIWQGSKSNMIIQGQETITGDHKMKCMLFGDEITFAPQIKNWWQAIAVGSVNTGSEILKGALSGAMTGMGIGMLGGSIKLALPTLSSIGGNVAASFGIVGSSVRSIFGVQNATNEWARGNIGTMAEAATAFKDGALPEAGSIYRICTGQAQGQDALLALYLLNVRFPNKTANNKSSSSKNDRPVKNTTQKTQNKASNKNKTGEAYESGKSASAQAKSWQGKPPYTGVDKWRNITLKKGTKIVGGHPGQSEYYTTMRGFNKTAGNTKKLWEGLQVKPHPKFGYRKQVAIYEVTEVTQAAFGATKANPQFGKGGLPQIYVPKYGTNLKIIEIIDLK